MLSTVWIIYYQGQKPHIEGTRIKTEVFNEVMLMIIMYHLIMFSRFNLNDDLKFLLGYTHAGSIILMVFVNIVLMMRKIIAKFMSNRRKKANYEAWLKKIKAEQEKNNRNSSESDEEERDKVKLGDKLRPVNHIVAKKYRVRSRGW